MQITFTNSDGKQITVSDPRRSEVARVMLPQLHAAASWKICSWKVIAMKV